MARIWVMIVNILCAFERKVVLLVVVEVLYIYNIYVP